MSVTGASLSPMSTRVWWLRRDLRVADHPALLAAADGGAVVPLFVLDPALWAAAGAPRQARLLASLRSLDADLRDRYAVSLVVRVGSPLTVVPALATEVGAVAVHVTAETTPYAVSYTHLDVYKRQSFRRPSRPTSRPPHPRGRRHRFRHWCRRVGSDPRQLPPRRRQTPTDRRPTVRRSTIEWTTSRRSATGWTTSRRSTRGGSLCPRSRPHQPRVRPMVRLRRRLALVVPQATEQCFQGGALSGVQPMKQSATGRHGHGHSSSQVPTLSLIHI